MGLIAVLFVVLSCNMPPDLSFIQFAINLSKLNIFCNSWTSFWVTVCTHASLNPSEGQHVIRQIGCLGIFKATTFIGLLSIAKKQFHSDTEDAFHSDPPLHLSPGKS